MSRIKLKKENLCGALFVVLLVVVVTNCLSCRSALAATGVWIGDGNGSSSGGGGGDGSDCNNSENKYRIDCAGASWIYYKTIEGVTTSEDITFPYLKIKGAVNAKIDHVCSEVGGFWHFGVNANGTFISGNSLINSDSGWYGHWVTLDRSVQSNYRKPPLNATFLRQNIGGVYEADHYGTDAEVLNAYKIAYRLSKNGTEEYTDNSLPDNLWGFCAGEDDPEYYARSYVQVEGAGDSGWADTKVVNNNIVQVTAKPDKVYNIGDVVEVEFNHQIYSNLNIGQKDWRITGCQWNALAYVVKSGSVAGICTPNSEQNEVARGSDGFNNFLGGKYYTTVRTNKIKISFSEAGTWMYCENVMNFENTTTSACAEIHVKEADRPEYYAESNVSVIGGENSSGEDWNTTGIVTSGDASYPKDSSKYINLKVGVEGTVVFSHNIYSDKVDTDNDVGWELIRNGAASVVSGKDYEIVSTKTCGESGLVGFGGTYGYTDHDGKVYYKGGPRNCNDGEYIARDEYKIKFTTEDGFVKMCQTVKVNSEQKTQVCANVRAYKDIIGNDNIYYAKSNVAIRPEVGEVWDTTEIVESGGEKTVKKKVNKNENVDIVFSHNIYAKDSVPSDKSVGWGINGRRDIKGSGFELVETKECGSVGDRAYFPSKDGNSYGYYVGLPTGASALGCTDGTWPYIMRDVYTIKFTSESGYAKICQTVTVDGQQKTEVCAELTAGGTIPSTPCNEWIPSSYTSSNSNSDRGSGETSVVAKIKNTTLGQNWLDSTYAKPNDEIDWLYCYYPGVQKVSNVKATTNHIKERNGYPNDDYALIDLPLSNGFFGSWQNLFKLSASGGFNPLFSGLTRSNPNGDDSIIYYKTQNGDSNASQGNGGKTTYVIRPGEASNNFDGIITSGVPVKASVTKDTRRHSWKCHWSSNDCGACGSYEVCSGSGEERTCTTYCRSCYTKTCIHIDNKPYIANSRTNGPVTANANVMIPYNFINEVSVSLNQSTVYAGEKVGIESFDVTIKPKYNSKTMKSSDSNYSTQVDDAEIKLVSYVYNTGNNPTSSDGSSYQISSSSEICSVLGNRVHLDSNGQKECQEIDDRNNLTMNSSGYATTDKVEHYARTYFGKDYNVYDENAGMYFCVVAAVYPYTSGEDDNLKSSGDKKWYISSPSCAKIAKKPTFQVRGGSIYSDGSINSIRTEKNNLEGGLWNYKYKSNGGNEIVFSSWVEQSLVLNGVTSSVASGASINNTSGNKENENYCESMAPLSFANYANTFLNICMTTQQVGKSGISAAGKDSVVDYWQMQGMIDAGYTSVNLNVNHIEDEDGRRYVYSSKSFELSGATIGVENNKGITYVVRSDGSIHITDDLRYDDRVEDHHLSVANMIPKLIIYAKGDINISCSVKRIDAILITDGTLNTCASSSGSTPGLNDPARSNKLVINGVIKANKILFNRTYGTASGKNSGVPAEIVNYDTSSILWGRSVVESNDFETINTVYQRELAPRY